MLKRSTKDTYLLLLEDLDIERRLRVLWKVRSKALIASKAQNKTVNPLRNVAAQRRTQIFFLRIFLGRTDYLWKYVFPYYKSTLNGLKRNSEIDF